LSIFEQVARIVGETFFVSADAIRPETTAHDVEGWDSVTQVHLLLALEDHFQIELPAEAALRCRNVGELGDLIQRRVASATPRVANIIVFGNCQTEMMAAELNYLPGTRERARFHHMLSFHHPTLGWAKLEDEVLASADVLWQQHDEQLAFPYADRLPESCRRISFPSLDFNLFWPFAGHDPRNTLEPPHYPFGRFPYGDMVALQVVKEGLRGEAAVRSYAELSRARLGRMSMARLEEIEFTRLAQREAQCDVAISDFIRANFRTVPTFHTWNHPGGRPMIELMKRLLIASDVWDATPGALMAGELHYCSGNWNPFAHFELPIHPMVAELLRLEWYDPQYRYKTYYGLVTHDEFIRHYVEGDTP
jgi:acyl carrier protein